MMCLLGSAAARVSVNALFPGVYLGDAYYSILNNNMERRINKVRRHNQKYFTAWARCSRHAFHLAQSYLERGKYFESNLINFVERHLDGNDLFLAGLSSGSDQQIKSFCRQGFRRRPFIHENLWACLSAVNIFKNLLLENQVVSSASRLDQITTNRQIDKLYNKG